MARIRLLFVFLACLLLAACARQAPHFHATDLTGASFGHDFELTDHNGRPRSLKDFRGKVVILYFGYTACPDICPTTLSRFAEVLKGMPEDAGRIQLLFVTLDPERDTAARLKDFVPWFYPTFLGLRGDAARTRAVAADFRVFSARREVGGALGYVLDHSSGAYAFDPAGRLRLFIKDDERNPDVTADLRLLLAGR